MKTTTKALITTAALGLFLSACGNTMETWAELDARCPNDQVTGGAGLGNGAKPVGCKGDPGFPGKSATENSFGSATGAVAR